MTRNFPNFLDAFVEYAKDDVCPDAYILWTGLSLLAGALERKVWVIDGRKTTYPNLFVLLVGSPGAGKSQAIKKAKPLLYGLKEHVGDFRIIEGITTQAGLCESMEQTNRAPDGSDYSSVYLIGSEASDSALKNHADDFRSTACAMYDCERKYEKTLKTKHYDIPNPVMNLIAGSTYDFLKTIVDQNSVMGGLASRFTYVIDERELPEESTLGLLGDDIDGKTTRALIDDLITIHQLQGAFRFEKSALDLHTQWWKNFRVVKKAITSERMQSLLVRKPMLLKKVLMLLSVAERNDLGITFEHMKRAIVIVEYVTKDYAKVISSAIMGNKNSQEAINLFFKQTIAEAGGCIEGAELRRKFIAFGGDVAKYDGTLAMLINGKELVQGASDGLTYFKLLVEPNANL